MAKTFEELRQAYKELLADNQQLIADSRKLRNEVAELKQLNDGYVKIIAKNQETNNKLMASVQKQTDGDLISRADAIEAVLGLAQLNGRVPTDSVIFQIKALPSADVIEFDFNKYQPRVRNKVNDGRPSADAVHGWIPCSEKMPKELEQVNVTWLNHNPPFYYQNIKDIPQTDTAVYYRGKWYWWDATVIDILAEYGEDCNAEQIDKDIEVVAWTQLPKPYKGGDDE